MPRRLLIGLAAVAAAWLLACLVLFVWPPAENGAPEHADAVVVLSGATDRLAPALALIERRVAPVLALSSVSRTRKWKAGRQLCAAKAFDSAAVLCFNARPYDTRGEAETVARIARARHWHSIVIVSSTYHLTRAKLLFDRCFGGKLSFVGAATPWWRLFPEWVTETGKLFVQLTIQRTC